MLTELKMYAVVEDEVSFEKVSHTALSVSPLSIFQIQQKAQSLPQIA